MARWKKNNDGSAYYDPNDSGPDQVAPPPGGVPGQPSQPGQGFLPGEPAPSTGGIWAGSQGPLRPPDNYPGKQYDWSSASQPGESPSDTLARYQRDYHSDDRDQVLAQMGNDPSQMMHTLPWKGNQPGTGTPGGGDGYKMPPGGGFPGAYTPPTGGFAGRGTIDPGQLQSQQTAQAPAGQPSDKDILRDYWAPDRTAVLAQRGYNPDGTPKNNAVPYTGPALQEGGTQPPAATPAAPAQAPAAPAAAPSNGITPGQVGQYMPQGYDQGKWNDPNKHDPKYDVGRVLSKYPPTPAGLKAAEAELKALGFSIMGDDKIVGADGKPVDVGRGFSEAARTGGQGAWQWGAAESPEQERQRLAAGGGQGGQGIPGGSVGGLQSQLSTGLSNPGGRSDSLYDTLLGRSGQSLNVNGQDPIIASQVQSFRADQERGARNAIDAQAESQGPQANLGSERRLASEHAAQATGGMRAQLMQNELNARRTEIQNALTQMGGMLSEQQKLALQEKLSLIDAQLRQQQITNQNSQFLDQLGLSAADRASYWDAIRSGLLG